MAEEMAHELNNTLVATLMQLSLVLSRPGLDASVKDSIIEIEEALQDASDLSRMLLTFSRGEPSQMIPGSDALPTSEESVTGSETILLVEDEAVVRRNTALCLRKLGYAVLEACQADEALKIWRQNPGRIELLLTDMVMPDSSDGLTLAGDLMRERTGLKVILTSGFPLKIDSANIVQLLKPYRPGYLARVIRHCLDDNGPHHLQIDLV